METLMRFHSSARPFVDNIQKGIARHLNYDVASVEDEVVCETVDESALGQLPVEIRHTICSFLSSSDLLHLSQVSCAWNLMCNDEVHWKAVFDREKLNWDSIQCYAPTASLWNKFSSQASYVSDLWSEYPASPLQQNPVTFPKWKTTLTLNHLANLHKSKATSPASSSLSSSSPLLPNSPSLASLSSDVAQSIKANAPALASKIVSKISPVVGQLKVPFKKTYRIPMFGEGLESTSKDLLYSMMWPQNAPLFAVTGLFPGVEGMGSGVGFNVDNVNMNIAALHRCHLDDLRSKWKSYFQKSDGIIYVVSCKNMFNTPVRKHLAHIVAGEEPLVPTKSPLLVLLVCDDPLGATVRPSEMAEQLNLDELEGRAWCVQLVDMSTLSGLPQGLSWLASKV
eukprot:Phypoly_transcript_10160.p1 GENE.Phypoly_transcript_10160~~Phypoly_transcript_10160.p1  ORF type:complete len:427 (+),score=76.99 Phypoly_transcript_10160:96-1283(+)